VAFIDERRMRRVRSLYGGARRLGSAGVQRDGDDLEVMALELFP
jgi:hypothetical protein